jgi:hypothetical protein
LEDFPSLVPPWPVCWIEYPNQGTERRGVLVVNVTDDAPKIEWDDNPWQVAIRRARQMFLDDRGVEPRWHIMLVPVIESDKKVHGSYGVLALALDEHGRAWGNGWAMPPGLKLRDEHADRLDNDPSRWLLLIVAPALQALAFLHCKNLRTQHHAPPPKLSKRHQKRHGHPLVRWRTISLEVPRKDGGDGQHGSGDDDRGLHIVAGNMHHYGDCCPGVHPPNGLLFGKHEGIYWVPSHARGNPARGVVLTDFDLKLGDDAANRDPGDRAAMETR